jgi:hypothetical protein
MNIDKPPERCEPPPEASLNWRFFSLPFHYCLQRLKVKFDLKVDYSAAPADEKAATRWVGIAARLSCSFNLQKHAHHISGPNGLSIETFFYDVKNFSSEG